MHYFMINRIAVAVFFLAGIFTSPFSFAQTEGIINLFSQDSSGAYLGIQMEDVTATNMSKYKLDSERGVVVRSVIKDSPAEAANIKEDDVILEYGGYQVWSTIQFSRLVKETPVGRTVDLVVSRDGKRVDLTAKIKEHEERRAANLMEFPEGILSPDGRSFSFQMPTTPRDERSDEPSAQKPRLGVMLQPLTEQMGEFLGVPKKKGALVVSVDADSPSDGKIKSGDVIIGADSKNIDSPEDLTGFIRNSAGGDIMLKIIRDKKEMKIVITLPEDDSNKGYKL